MMLDEPIPAAIDDLVKLCRRMVKETIGVEPDLTPETLPLVDQHLRQVPVDASHEVRELVVTSVGCYFGEVARRHLNGRWALPGEDPSTWRVELETCFLYFWPVGMAGEVLSRKPSDEHDGSFATADDVREELSSMLASAPPVSEEEYYSLSGRIETLELVADWLTARRLERAAGEAVPVYGPEDYRRAIDEPTH